MPPVSVSLCRCRARRAQDTEMPVGWSTAALQPRLLFEDNAGEPAGDGGLRVPVSPSSEGLQCISSSRGSPASQTLKAIAGLTLGVSHFR